MKPPPSLVVSSPFDEFAESTAIPSTPTGSHIVHQITNVPLVSGEFGVRWKFKNVHAPTRGSSKLLDIVKGRSSSRSPLNGRKGKGKDVEDDADSNSQGSTEQLPDGRDSRPITPDWNHTHSHLFSSSNTTTSSIPHTLSSHTTTSSSSSSAPSLTFTPPPPPSTTSSPSDFSPAHTPTTARARGQTPFVRLRDHTASWEHTIDVVVRMDIERSDAARLLPSPLKLVVTQPREREELPHPHKPSNPRLGAVYLDLAQYAEKGEVMRRYLLRESKTNALLKLSIQLTHISGPTNFHAPLLPKGEILNGISGIILENDVYRSRPKGLDIYGPYYDLEELEYDLFGHGEDESDTDGVIEDGNGNENQDEGDNTDTARSDDSRHKSASDKFKQTPKPKAKATINGRSFDPERLPLAYGPKTTETLIEAIFNPVKTTEKRRESPFTILVSVDGTEEGGSSDSASQQQVLRLNHHGMGIGAGVGASAGVGTGTGPGKRPPPSPLRSTHPSGSGSGIGAGLGIMGLGMGMGIGLGVGLGVEGGAARGGGMLSANGGGGSTTGRSETNGNGNLNGGRWKASVDGRGLKGKGKAVAQDTSSVRTTSSGDLENDRDKDRDREYDHDHDHDHASLATRSMSTSTSHSTWSMHSGEGEGEGEEAWSESSHSHSQSRSHSREGEYEGGGPGRGGEGGRVGGVKGWWMKHASHVGLGTGAGAAMSKHVSAQASRV